MSEDEKQGADRIIDLSAMRKGTILTEGVVLATIPIVAYYAAYQYEVGYYRVFGAPENLISVDISTFIALGSATLALFFTLYNISNMFWPSELDKLSEMSWRRTITQLLLIFLGLWALFYLFYQSGWLKSAIPPTFIVVMLFLFRLGMFKAYPKWLFFFFILVVLLGDICQGIGQFNGKTQIKFTVITSEKDTFVIRKLGNYFLCSTYDANSRTFVRNFRLMPIKDEGLSLEYKNISHYTFHHDCL